LVVGGAFLSLQGADATESTLSDLKTSTENFHELALFLLQAIAIACGWVAGSQTWASLRATINTNDAI
jgi:hypothetical protein